MTAHIRRALQRDRPRVIETVTAAFGEDPAWGFLFGQEYERLAPEFAGTLFDQRVIVETVWVSDDLAAVAMWEAPQSAHGTSSEARALWARFCDIAGEDAHGRLIAYNRAVDAAAAQDRVERGDYWYLGVLATAPERRRQGLAGAVIAPAVMLADGDGRACCLETSTDYNRRFYERRGFTETSHVAIAEGPPTVWLRRPPRVQ